MTTPSMGERIKVRSRSMRARIERRLVLLERRLGVGDLRLGDGEVRLGALLERDGGVERGLRRGALDHELLGPAEIELGLVQIGLRPRHAGDLQIDIRACHGDAGLALAHAGLEARRLDPRQHGAALHLARIVDIDLADIAGKLRADIDGDERAHGPRRGDDAAHVAALRRRRLDVELPGALPLPVIIETGAGQACQDENEQEPLSHALPSRPAIARNGRRKAPQNGKGEDVYVETLKPRR